MTNDTPAQTPAPKGIFALSVLVFLPPAGLATFFLLDAYGLLETYQRLTLLIILFLVVVWLGAITYGINRTRNVSGYLLLAMPILAFGVLILSNEHATFGHMTVILASLVGMSAFGVGFLLYASKLLSLRIYDRQVLSLPQSLTLLILATTTAIIGTTGAGTFLDLYTLRERATINSKTYHLLTFDELFTTSYVYLYACNSSGFNCDLLRLIATDSGDIFDTPDQIRWEISEGDGVAIITVFRDDVVIHTEYLE
ncbi:MAG: hypothetical protein RLP44_28070 [Aggregatilineales bacterium]